MPAGGQHNQFGLAHQDRQRVQARVFPLSQSAAIRHVIIVAEVLMHAIGAMDGSAAFTSQDCEEFSAFLF